MEIRPAESEDAAEIAEVLNRSIREVCGPDYGNDGNILARWANKSPDVVRQGLVNANQYWNVAVQDTHIVGTSLIVFDGEIRLCYVLPEYLRRGFGKALLSDLLNKAHMLGLRKVRLTSTRTALSFYKKNGFISLGETVAMGYIPGYAMERDLGPTYAKSKLSQIRAVLFDIDGTLLNTFDFIYGAFDYALRLHGIEPLPRERISELMGGPLEEVYATMAPGFDRTSLAEAHRVFQSENLALASLFPDTLDVLEELKNRGLKLAAITTRSLRTSVRSLEITGIAKYFDIIISAEDVSFHKPHPEPLLKALDVLNVKPEEAIMVGDTRADIMAGKNAGTKTVAALYGFGGKQLKQLQPDVAISKLNELLNLL